MQVYRGLKQTDDESDAQWIAEMLRLKILPTGYIDPAAERPVRDMLRRRLLISRQATQTLLSVQSMVTRQTAAAVGAKQIEERTKVEVDGTFADRHSRATAVALLELLREQRRLQHHLEKEVLAARKLQGSFRRLLGVPGIGACGGGEWSGRS